MNIAVTLLENRLAVFHLLTTSIDRLWTVRIDCYEYAFLVNCYSMRSVKYYDV